MPCLRVLQASLVYITTSWSSGSSPNPTWAHALAPADRRGLTPLFWTQVAPYGRVELDMTSRLDPELAACMRHLRLGDSLVVWKFDWLGRSTQHLLSITEQLRERDIHFRTLTEAIDTSTPAGRLMFTMMAAIAAFERDLIVERTRTGMAAAGERGIRPGPRTVMTPCEDRSRPSHARRRTAGRNRVQDHRRQPSHAPPAPTG